MCLKREKCVKMPHLLHNRAPFHQHMKARRREGQADSLSSLSLSSCVCVFVLYTSVCLFEKRLTTVGLEKCKWPRTCPTSEVTTEPHTPCKDAVFMKPFSRMTIGIVRVFPFLFLFHRRSIRSIPKHVNKPT